VEHKPAAIYILRQHGLCCASICSAVSEHGTDTNNSERSTVLTPNSCHFKPACFVLLFLR